MLKKEEHENSITQLAELLNVEGVDQGKASLLLQNLRENYEEIDVTIANNTKDINTFKQLNDSLVFSNSELLSKLSIQKEKNIDQNRGTNNQSQQQQGTENIKSLDEIAKSFI